MWDYVDPVRWDTHPDVQRFLGFANGDPTFDILKDIESPNPTESQSHDRAGNPTVSPANCSYRWEKIAADAPYTGFTVIEERPIYTTHAIIVQVLNKWDAEAHPDGVHGRRE
jgi:hypothetical protein